MAVPATKTCASCGRRIEWRRRWARDWEQVRYCSAACRSRRLTPIDRALEGAILELLDRRPAAATICPSEAARKVAADQPSAGEWRSLMEPTRRAARRLVDQGRVDITQGGRPVDPSTAKGPIRIRTRGGTPANPR